jgi:hypothetical protein
MKINEVVSGMKWFVANVRCIVPQGGTITTRIGIKCDNSMSARFLLSRTYGKENVFAITQVIDEQALIDEPSNDDEVLIDEETYGANTKVLTPQQLQIKALKDKSKQMNDQAKKIKAQTQVTKAQQKLAKATQASM